MINDNNAILLYLAILLVSFVLHPSAQAAEAIPATFADYQAYEVGNHDDSGTLYLAPGLSASLITTKSDRQDLYGSVQLTIDGKRIRVGFDPGPSEDPMFTLQVNGGKQYDIAGRTLYVSGSGALYANTDSNDYFSRARKFRLVKNSIEEVAQPYYLVDLHCKTSSVVTLYTRQCNRGDSVAVLPVDTKVHVLLAEYQQTPCNKTAGSGAIGSDKGMSFLVTSPFGLTGWVTSTPGYLQTPGRPLDCIVFHGD